MQTVWFYTAAKIKLQTGLWASWWSEQEKIKLQTGLWASWWSEQEKTRNLLLSFLGG